MPSVDDPRRSPRAKVLLAATIECGGRVIPVMLRDLSEHGALIETREALSVDAKVLFRRKELQVPGFVAWARTDHAGIAFALPLKSEEVLRHISRSPPRPVEEPIHRRPALTRPGMSREEQRWADEMMREPARRGDPR